MGVEYDKGDMTCVDWALSARRTLCIGIETDERGVTGVDCVLSARNGTVDVREFGWVETEGEAVARLDRDSSARCVVSATGGLNADWEYAACVELRVRGSDGVDGVNEEVGLSIHTSSMKSPRFVIMGRASVKSETLGEMAFHGLLMDDSIS